MFVVEPELKFSLGVSSSVLFLILGPLATPSATKYTKLPSLYVKRVELLDGGQLVGWSRVGVVIQAQLANARLRITSLAFRLDANWV